MRVSPLQPARGSDRCTPPLKTFISSSTGSRSGRHAPYYTALEKGFYASKNLNVTIAQGNGTMQGLRTLIAGKAQFVFQDLGVMMAVRAKEGAKIRALACLYQKSPHTVFFIEGKGISKPKDLEGTEIASPLAIHRS